MPEDPDPGLGGGRPWNVFVSSTVTDFKAFRAAVRDDLQRYAEAACFLSEDWVVSFDDTVARCRARVTQSDGFILLLGHYYGSIPPGSEKSVTHIEFDAALERWRGDFPPVAVMRPRAPSDADRVLNELAAKILGERAAEPGFDRDAYERKQRAFRDSVVNSWRTVNEFGTAEELSKQAITCTLRWQGKSPERAAAGLVAVKDQRVVAVTDADLGRLGRDTQLARASELLSLAAAEPQVPGIALVVHGPEDAGHSELLAALAAAEPALKHCRPGALPTRHASLAALASWAGQAFGLTRRDGLATPEALADRVFLELKRGGLAFILNRIALLAGGLQAFTDEFWTPLYRRLEQLADGQPFQHQLVVVIGQVAADQAVVDAATNAPPIDDDLPDYSRPLRLPRLEAITRTQLLTWLARLDVPGNLRADLADAALKDDSGGDDRVPSRVYRRLREQWPD